MAGSLRLPVRDVVPEGPRAVVLRVGLGDERLDFRAGQAVWLGRADRAKTKPYSIACSPGRARETGHLEFLITTDLHGRAGSHLDPLESGAVLSVEGPAGSFTLPSPLEASGLLFVAGGAGVAPLRAMIQEVLSRPDPPIITLVHSARTSPEFAFADEFDALSRAGLMRVLRTATRSGGPAGTTGGRITREFLARLHVTPETRCFVCGPDALVGDVSLALTGLGVPRDRISREEWA